MCESYFLGICWIKPTSTPESIFAFDQFIPALALLVVVFTVADVRYRFRLAIAPLPLYRLTFVLIGVIGFGTLLTDIWLRQKWLVPQVVSYLSASVLQGIFGALFLTLAMTWMWYAFIRPPIFGTNNARRFGQELYRIILKGSDSELPIIANELGQSAESLLLLAHARTPTKHGLKQKSNASGYAHDLLLLIGNRKLCRHVVAASPGTAIIFFATMAEHRLSEIPMGQFSKNISAEAILNKDSLLYHEDEGYSSDLLGYLKPFSQAIYGNYELVERLGDGSPLDVDYLVKDSWDASQWEVYCRAVLLTFSSYIKNDHWRSHSSTLYRAFEAIKSSFFGVYKINEMPTNYFSSDEYARLRAAVYFVQETVDLIGKQNPLPTTQLRRRKAHGSRDEDFYDHIAKLMFEIIFAASSIKGPPDMAWGIHHNAVWSQFFSFHEGGAWRVVHFKLRRLLYDEIANMDEYFNYKGARILGYCLNVMGISQSVKKERIDRDYWPLRKVVTKWTTKNYLRLRDDLPDVADEVLIGSITFDEANHRLVKTYIKGLSKEAPKDYLVLDVLKGTIGKT